MASSGKPANLLYKNKSRGQLYVKQCVVDQPNTQDRVITETPGKGRRTRVRGQLYVKQCVVDQPNTQDRVITETPGKRRGTRVRVSSM